MFDSPLLNTLQAGLDYSSARQSALASNVANVNTPGYKRHDVSFDNVLQAAESASDPSIISPADVSDDSTLQLDDPRQIPLAGDQDSSGPAITTDNSGEMRLDGNNIDMDIEMGRLAKNEIYYQGLTQMMAGQFADLKNVIKGG